MQREISSGWLMFFGFRAAEDRILTALAEAGYADITRAQARLLAGIDVDGSRLVVLADRARIPKQTALALVNGLEAAGYVERAPDPSDGRARLIRLAARGRGVVPVAIAEEARLEAEWQTVLGVRRMRALRKSLWELALSADPHLDPPEASGSGRTAVRSRARPAGPGAQQADGVAAADGGDGVVVEPSGEQPVDRVVDAHVEGVVAAQRHLARSHHGDQVTQLLGRVDQ